MIGLALSGGGVKGSYQVGAFFAFKKCKIKFSGMTGTSIGAFNAAVLACHMEDELYNFWRNVDVGRILGFDDKYLSKIKLNQKDLEYFLLTVDNIIEILNNKGISIKGLEQLLKDFDLEKKLRKSNIEYGLSTLRLKDAKPLDLFVDDIPYGSLNNYIIASCYLPIFKQEKLEDDSYFFDGGIFNYCPINMLLDKGYSKVYAIDLKAIGISQKVKDSQKVIYIKPSRKLSGMLSLDQKAIYENMQMGYYDTLRVLKKYDGYKYVFKRKSEKYYNRICCTITDKTLALAMGFLGKTSRKELIIKAIEYLMEQDKVSYYDIYDTKKILKLYQKKDGKSIALKIIKELKF